MVKTEFGIIDEIDINKDYSEYEPHKYHCVFIDDDAYINDWWLQLCKMKTFFHRIDRPNTALARYGVTIIPPESLQFFLSIVKGDSRINSDKHLSELATMIQTAMDSGKHMIHFGV